MATATKKKTKVRPLGDRIVVRRVATEEKTKGGIVLPDQAKEKPKEGVVIAVGPGTVLDSGKHTEPQLSENDRVLFGSYAGTEVKVDGEEFLIMRENDVLAVITG